MANYKELKPGDKVWIKESRHVRAEVVGPRPGDSRLPPEEQTWKLEILPDTLYLPPEDFELIDAPKNPNAPLQRYSKEWAEEIVALGKAAERVRADNTDQQALNTALDSMEKLGIIKPRK